MTEKRLAGRLSADRIGVQTLPPFPAHLLAGFRAIDDVTSAASDALDALGLSGAIPGAVLGPSLPGSRLVGRALTVDNRPGSGGLADVEAHNLAEPGDVLVVRGVPGISSMGRVSASIGKRQGELGAIVDGAVRDLEATTALPYPVWSRGPSPITGKSRLETVAINRPVEIAGIVVHPGDLVLADWAGVVFVPAARAAEVLEEIRRAARVEAAKLAAIAAGVPIPDLPGVRRD